MRVKTAASPSPSTSKRTSRFWIVTIAKSSSRKLQQAVMRDLQAFDRDASLGCREIRAGPFDRDAAAEHPRDRRGAALVEQPDRAVAPGAERLMQACLIPGPQPGLAHDTAAKRQPRPRVPYRQLMHEIRCAAFRIGGDLEIRTEAFDFLKRAAEELQQ